MSARPAGGGGRGGPVRARAVRRARLLLLLAVLFAASAAALVALGFETSRFGALHDEGSAVHASERIAHGEQLYRDLLYFKAPLSYYGLAWVFEVFPITLATARVAGALLLGVLGVLAAVLATRLAAEGEQADAAACAAGAAVWLLVLANVAPRVLWHNSWCALLAVLAALLVHVEAERRARPRLQLAVGALVGVALLAKQNFGIALFGGLLAHRALLAGGPGARRAAGGIGRVGLGLALVLAVWAAFAASQGALRDTFALAVLYPLRAPGLAQGLFHPPPLPGGADAAELALYYVPPLLLLWIAGSSLRGARRGEGAAAARLAYAIPALLLYAPLFPRAGLGHLRPILVISLLALAPLLADALRGRGAVLPVVLGSCVALATCSVSVRMIAWPGQGQPLPGPRAGGVAAAPERAAELAALLAALDRRAAPGEPIFVVPWAPMVYFLSGRPNPTRIRIVWPGQWDAPRYQSELVERLEARQVGLVVFVRDQENFHGVPFARYAALLDDYLRRHYALVERVGDYDVLERRRGGPRPGRGAPR